MTSLLPKQKQRTGANNTCGLSPHVRCLGAKLHLYPNEIALLLKIFNHVDDNNDIMDALNDDEFEVTLWMTFIDAYKDTHGDVAINNT